ncbi:MAG: SMP-30/gluconolactonase/LRE family protein [Ignavibacteriae bacterium]|nr:SMP-30/gluconolactonase/LRE family protein [Ignavibacteriota bacterium]
MIKIKQIVHDFRKLVFIIIVLGIFQTDLFSQIIIEPNLVVEEIAKDIQQPEGPIWNDNLGLLFSDIKGNKIYRWTQGNGKEIFLDDSDSTNGLAYDLDDKLIAGQMGKRRIVRFENDGTQTSLADNYEGKKFNSPNDLVVKSDGSIFFTDPDFNIPNGQKKELSFNGIYRISPIGKLQLLSTLTLPNGICFSPDESKLYVNDSQAHKIYVWDVVDDSTITNKKLFFTIPVNGYADGMKTDTLGNIYCTCSSAVWVISPNGEQIGKINLPTNVSASNCTWGDFDRKTLFITAGKSVYKTRPILTSLNGQNSVIPTKIMLYQNYPNPFNPTTKIKYNIPKFSYVTLKIFNLLGNEVKTLQKGFLQPGSYSVTVNSEGLPSGIYFYRLDTEDNSLIKKLVILK